MVAARRLERRTPLRGKGNAAQLTQKLAHSAHLGGIDVFAEPLDDRRARLCGIVSGADAGVPPEGGSDEHIRRSRARSIQVRARSIQVEDSKGERVVVTTNGKFLTIEKW